VNKYLKMVQEWDEKKETEKCMFYIENTTDKVRITNHLRNNGYTAKLRPFSKASDFIMVEVERK
jgi:hypothetical protein